MDLPEEFAQNFCGRVKAMRRSLRWGGGFPEKRDIKGLWRTCREHVHMSTCSVAPPQPAASCAVGTKRLAARIFPGRPPSAKK